MTTTSSHLRDGHLDPSTLEAFARSRIQHPAELARINEHLLACDNCKNRLRVEVKKLPAPPGSIKIISWKRTYQTDYGKVELLVYRGVSGEHIGRISGPCIDSGSCFPTAEEAQDWCDRTYFELFRSRYSH